MNSYIELTLVTQHRYLAEQKGSKMRAQYQAYLLRFWREEGESQGGSQVEWHSQVDHVATGRRMTFKTVEELLDYLRQQTVELTLRKGSENR